jgi:two-component system NtrC family sensor kinase
MVKSEGFFGLTSLIRPKKDILWVGSERETPHPVLNSYLPKIKFVTAAESITPLNKNDYRVVVISRHAKDPHLPAELMNYLETQKTTEKILILNGKKNEQWSNETLELLNATSYFKVIFSPDESVQINDVIKEALEHGTRATQSHGQIETKVTQMKTLVKFVKGISNVSNIKDLMSWLGQECKPFPRVKEPILAIAITNDQLRLFYFQGAQVIEKSLSGVWPQQMRIRTNDVKDSQYLANIFGRPFGKLLTIPLKLRRKSTQEILKVSAVLYFEHALSVEEISAFVQFIEERLEPVSIALDRLLLEQDLKETSLLWERTFDGFQDPVVIFDEDGQILRANKAFAENLNDVPVSKLHSDSLRHDDNSYEIHSYPISHRADMRPTNIINHYVDVTHAHRLQKQMIQNEKMAALGHLAGHIAHELNNPLTGIRSLSQILIQQTTAGTTVQNDLLEVEKATERCQVIIKNLLEFSSGEHSQQQVVVSLNDVVNRTLPLLNTLISRFRTEIQLTEKNCDVYIEPHLMQQVVFNIIKNATQAMNELGKLTIITDVKDGMVQLVVRDTGSGIPPEILNQIFDYFFTTKAQGQGTGLGLSMSKNIVDSFGGKIEVRSDAGQGTEFIITLPHKGTRKS